VLARRSGDFAAAEDAVQEALIAAASHWPRHGLPENPRGWLIQTASRRLVDQWRSDRSRWQREALVEEPPPHVPDRDDTLAVLFMCCHPSLSPASAIALTLRAVGGLTTAEIARAFLVGEATMAQRISRAKQTIKESGEPFQLQPERLHSVLRVLYLIFNEGYASERADLAEEAIRITRMLHRLLPDDGEVAGLLALMLLIEARRSARTGSNGDLIPLAEQDRTLWDRERIAEGTALLDGAIGKGTGEYQLQAAIAALHDRATRAEETDWPQILALYGLLEQLTGNPVVTLNKAVAAGMADGPEAGLAVLEEVGERLAGHYRLDAVRAHLLEQAGDAEAAREHYRAAAAGATNLAEQRHLALRAARLRKEEDGSGAARWVRRTA
jgi:RNA polymerase sigma factor (sigma-70 family)